MTADQCKPGEGQGQMMANIDKIEQGTSKGKTKILSDLLKGQKKNERNYSEAHRLNISIRIIVFRTVIKNSYYLQLHKKSQILESQNVSNFRTNLFQETFLSLKCVENVIQTLCV